MQGIYHIKMVPPAWTVEKRADAGTGRERPAWRQPEYAGWQPPVPLHPGTLEQKLFPDRSGNRSRKVQLTGQVDDDALHGVVVIEDTPDSLTGTKIK